MEVLLEFRSVQLGYRRKVVLRDISMDIRDGEFLGLVGPNGAGKTTLLRAILGTLRPLSGEVRWGPGRPSRIGYVPQRENLDPVWPLRVIDVVLMGRYALRGSLRRMTRDDYAASEAALEQTGVLELAKEPVATLSGGQVQRTLLARALTADPELLVLDEPTTGMDLAGQTAMLELVRRLHSDRGITVLLVSHDLNAVASVATRIALLHDGAVREGDVDSILSPEVLEIIYGTQISVGEVGGHRVVVSSVSRKKGNEL